MLFIWSAYNKMNTTNKYIVKATRKETSGTSISLIARN